MTKKQLKRYSHKFVDPLYKWVIFRLGIDKEYKQCLKDAYHGEVVAFLEFEMKYGHNILRVCENIFNARRRKVKTAKDKVSLPIELGYAFFVTLTFKDDVLANTSEATRRQYVQRAFKHCGKRYIANIDYGDHTQREHYHGIVEPLPDKLASWENGNRHYRDVPDFRNWCKKYGFVDIRKVGWYGGDVERVCKYTAKLTNHALKKSTLKGKKNPRLIYSRNVFG